MIDGDQSKAQFALLEANKAEIEADLGEPLTWYNAPAVRMCRIYLRKTAVLTDRTRWPEYQQWLLKKLEALHRVFALRVRHIDLAEDPGNEPPTGGSISPTDLGVGSVSTDTTGH